MPLRQKVETGCELVGQFVDEAEIPAGIVVHRGEPVRPVSLTQFEDDWMAGNSSLPDEGNAR